MDRDPQDRLLTTRFRELRAEDEQRAPAVQELLERPTARIREERQRPWAVAATVAASLGVLLIIVVWKAPFAQRKPVATMLWQWQSPTARLLHPFGEELLRGTPRLVVPVSLDTSDTKD